MTDMELYVRVLEELNWRYSERRTWDTRGAMQDVLIALRARAAKERGDILGEETQSLAEREARQKLVLCAWR